VQLEIDLLVHSGLALGVVVLLDLRHLAINKAYLLTVTEITNYLVENEICLLNKHRVFV
jgi:hypothetical protein